MPREVEVNENWETFTADQPVVVDWMIAPPNGTMTGTPAVAQFYETYGMPADRGGFPRQLIPEIREQRHGLCTLSSNTGRAAQQSATED